MDHALNVLGFTSVSSTLWNLLAYAAFVLIIVGVASERFRNAFTASGALALAAYANFFLHNDVFAILQTLVFLSVVFQMTGLPRESLFVSMLALTVGAYVYLLTSGTIHDVWAFIGSLGLLGIMIGLMALPKRSAFLIMAGGGALLVLYAYTAGAWVFFFLNIVYVCVNMMTWGKIGARQLRTDGAE